MGLWVEESGKSEGLPVMGRIGIESQDHIIPRESEQTSARSAHDGNTCGIRPKQEKQMTVEPPTAEGLSAVDTTGASFHGVTDWHAIDWESANHNVRRRAPQESSRHPRLESGAK